MLGSTLANLNSLAGKFRCHSPHDLNGGEGIAAKSKNLLPRYKRFEDNEHCQLLFWWIEFYGIQVKEKIIGLLSCILRV